MEKEVEKGIYFDLPYLRAGNNEVFVDAGGYDGESSLAFNSWSSGRGRIYLFEPSELSLNIAKEKLKNLSNVTYIEKGLYSSSTVMGFSNNGTESKISNDGSNQILVTTLDEYMDEIQPTFIKMDIEGAEYEALIGARKTIRKYKPKLAISIYHKPEDIVEIPELILSMNSDYKLWLRHYSMTWFDTVLYAI
ncbi:FkbM family methyltransferase [Butyrivibrio sp.]|uniref:FkbM family methyltransferase n=1 Tax=Butyrivibrio sp. TaxID=28121 RepID=UPI0025BC0AED|nr:FkbM family methyltransferase [Butyrivibrio sp.]MBQ9301572.1 FkbM family methyltransferase [Butyrivibrio sp.]